MLNVYSHSDNMYLCFAECGALDAPGNGTVDTTAGTTFGLTATFACNNGYHLVGDATSMSVNEHTPHMTFIYGSITWKYTCNINMAKIFRSPLGKIIKIYLQHASLYDVR